MSAAPFPIRLLSLEVMDFRGLAGEHSIDLTRNLTLVIGRNGAGKSSLLNAVEWCLFGAEATKKSASGIAERGDWVLAHTGATGGVRVTLQLAIQDGKARLTRSRAQGAKARDQDEVQLELPGNELLEGSEVQAWMAWNQMPDWKTWKRSFCQHQEQARDRVTDTTDRSNAIAGMLGLDEYRRVSAELKGLNVKRLEKRVVEELERLREMQQQARERPGQLRELEHELATHGVAVAQAGAAELEQRRSSLITQATEIGARLGSPAAELPRTDWPTDRILAWARGWPGHARDRLDTLLRERTEITARVRALEASLDSLAPARRTEADAAQERERLEAKLGPCAALHQTLVALAQERDLLDEETRQQDAAGKLLRDALAVLNESQDPHRCPVCDQTRADLDRVLRERMDAQGPSARQDEIARLQVREQELREQVRVLEDAERAHQVARRQVAWLEERVHEQLPAGTSQDTPIEELARSWQAEERALAEICEAADQHLLRQRGDLEVLELLIELRDARGAAGTDTDTSAEVDLSGLPAFSALQQVIDDAAGFAGDVEALGAMARELEDEQSAEQIMVVNDSIDTYMTTIVGESFRGPVRVQQKRTATRVTYQLVDEAGNVVTSLVNQAAFNALSLATLFASAESRARRGQPQFLLLDDPGQSLDDEHQAGLARALGLCAQRFPVVVGTFPGALAEALSMVGPEGPMTYRIARAPGAAVPDILED